MRDAPRGPTPGLLPLLPFMRPRPRRLRGCGYRGGGDGGHSPSPGPDLRLELRPSVSNHLLNISSRMSTVSTLMLLKHNSYLTFRTPYVPLRRPVPATSHSVLPVAQGTNFRVLPPCPSFSHSPQPVSANSVHPGSVSHHLSAASLAVPPPAATRMLTTRPVTGLYTHPGSLTVYATQQLE